jgi:hypothetical protein
MTNGHSADHFETRRINVTATVLRPMLQSTNLDLLGQQLGTIGNGQGICLGEADVQRRSPVGQLVSIANISRREHDGTCANGKQFCVLRLAGPGDGRLLWKQ